MPNGRKTIATVPSAGLMPRGAASRPEVADAADESERANQGSHGATHVTADEAQTALEDLRERDPYYDPPLPAPVQGHGPAHPAGQASRELGRLVAAYREARGLSQAALGERLGWPQPNVARLEAGHRTPDLATLDRLARRLGLEVTVRATASGIVVEVRDPAA